MTDEEVYNSLTPEQQKIWDNLKYSFDQVGEIVDFINDEEKVKKAHKSFMEHVKDYKVIDLNQK